MENSTSLIEIEHMVIIYKSLWNKINLFNNSSKHYSKKKMKNVEDNIPQKE